MDKGAARSRKRLEQLAKAETSISAGDNPLLKRLAEGESRDAGRDGRGGHRGGGRGGGSGSGGRGGAGGRGGFQRRDGSRPFRPGQDTSAQEGEATGSGTGSSRPERPKKKEMLDEAVRYKPKAIRSSAALIWSEGAFEVPPSVERMEGVRRVDLSGSGVTDVSWVKGGVTWLSLAGCPVEKGWEAIGELKELSVLNISGCGLTALPPSLAGLTNLKAIVAMNNPWTTLDDEVINQWTSLNSLIVSHSPSLNSIPKSLSSLTHLSKLTFSHCPLLAPSALPDLSPLPLLRDVKMNNLPLLSSLPKHLSTWGTGDLSLVRSTTSIGEAESSSRSGARAGDGLEVLDLGNCSLPYSAIEGIFIPPKSGVKPGTATWHLRSLSLHSNPLGTTHADYADRLQSSPLLPNLQIIDAKRVVERKRKGEVNESKAEKRAREKKEKKMKPSGANVDGSKVMRSWGAGDAGDDEDGSEGSADDSDVGVTTKVVGKDRKEKDRGKESKKRKADKIATEATTDEQDRVEGKKQKSDKKRRREAAASAARPVDADPEREDRAKRAKATPATGLIDSTTHSRPVPAPASAPADHTTSTSTSEPAKKYDPTAAPSAVLQVINVADDLTPAERKIKERREAKRAAKAAAKDKAGGEAYVKQKEARKRENEERKERELKEALGGKKKDTGSSGAGLGLGSGSWGGEDKGGVEETGAGLGVGGW